MAIPEDFIAELRERVDIVDVVGSYVGLKKAGSNFRAICPFHKEKTPSFMVSREKGIYKCFGCGASGNVITFVMETQKVGFVEAVKTLASRVGMKVPAGPGSPEEEGRNERLYEALEFAAQQFERSLWDSSAGARARAYLEKRGISVETARSFRLGYADASGGLLVRKASGLGVWDALVETGLIVESRASRRDMFRNRLIFPIQSASGRLVGFGGRLLDGTGPKYLNSRESPLFRKGSLLYGLPQAKQCLKDRGYAVLVEGYMDVLSLCQSGLSNALASAGTALTDRQSTVLKRFSDSVVIAYDGDEAGIRAAMRSLEVLVAAGLNARVARLESGEDPDSVVRKGGREAFERILKDAPDAVGFLAEGARSADMIERERAIRRVVSLLGLVPDPIRKQVMTQRASDLLGVSEEVLAEAGRALRGRVDRRDRTREEEESGAGAIPPLEKEFLRALLLAPELLGEVLESFDPELLGNPQARRLFDITVERWRSDRPVGASDLMDCTDDPALRAAIGEIAVEWEGADFDVARAVYDSMRRLRERQLRGKLESIKIEIRRKEATGLHEEVGDLAVQLQSITDELRSLRQGAS